MHAFRLWMAFLPLTTARNAASAADLNLAEVSAYTKKYSSTNHSQFSDIKPADWAYQVLSNLLEHYGCVAGYLKGSFEGGHSMTRYKAAALLNACLDRVTEITDGLKRLMKEFEPELVVLRSRVDRLEANISEMKVSQFSITTKLIGLASFVLGANTFNGSAMHTGVNTVSRCFNKLTGQPRSPVPLPKATTLNYDL